MRQVFQKSYLSKELCVEDVPSPSLQGTGVIVQNAISLISAGTERATIAFARKNLLDKLRSQPERLQLLWRKVQQNGLLDTLQLARRKLENPIPMGYSAAGIVLETSIDMPGIRIGDRVACAGAQYANHAEIVYIPKNLCVPLPENVSFEEGSFVAPGAIALHGVRLAEIGLGETILMIGLGLMGQLAAQLVQAQGGTVIGIDTDAHRLKIAQALGISHVALRQQANLEAWVNELTHGYGADKVLITAATASDDPVFLAGELCRERGKIVVLGDVGMKIPRSVYYKKELSVIVSRSYGPGRYDEKYERDGQDYPASYVRWTERDNMATFLQLVSQGKVSLQPLIEKRFAIADARHAYDLLADPTVRPQPLGMLLIYPEPSPNSATNRRKPLQLTIHPTPHSGQIGLSVIGTGQFMSGTLLPILKQQTAIQRQGVVSHTGLSAKTMGLQGRFTYCSTQADDIWQDVNTQAVLIATRHDSHATLVCDALRHQKHVFVEKPLAINRDELKRCIQTLQAHPEQHLMVGFNRRFSPLSQQLKHKRDTDACEQPIRIHYRIQAGRLPDDHWVHAHGGRLVGEVCHFIDWCQFLIGAEPTRVAAQTTGTAPNQDLAIQLQFADGSSAQIDYWMRLDMASATMAGKERIEINALGFTAEIQDFKTLKIIQNGKTKIHTLKKPDKGHSQEIAAFLQAIQSGQPTIPVQELWLTTETTFTIQDALKSGQWETISLQTYASDVPPIK